MRPSFLGNKIRICSRCGQEDIGNLSMDPKVKIICGLCVQKMLMAVEKNQAINLEEVKTAMRSRKLRQYRKVRGWTLRQLAEKLKVSYSFLCDIENGKRKPSEEWLNDLKAI